MKAVFSLFSKTKQLFYFKVLIYNKTDCSDAFVTKALYLKG